MSSILRLSALNSSLHASNVSISGWLGQSRNGISLSFFPLSDSSATVQLIVLNKTLRTSLHNIPQQSLLHINGTVLLRPQKDRRTSPTGDIDVRVDGFTLLNPATTLPFQPSSPFNLPNEDLRLRYRYLDLRRTALADNIKKRSKVAHIVRNLLHDLDFTEVETPILLRSSPEGAREFLVPTRSSSSPKFYALQQSPQQPKQLLICSGAIDRYYQLARCFRDEDGRKDRQPEFTQIDLEMAFVSWSPSHTRDNPIPSDLTQLPPPSPVSPYSQGQWRIGGSEVRDVVEALIHRIWRDTQGVKLPSGPFPVMTYHEAMSRFGSDKPDTRFGLEITNLNQHIHHSLSSTHVLECVIVRKSRDSSFINASHACEIPPGIERISITKENRQNWLSESSLIDNNADIGQLNRALGVKPGDQVWLARRSHLLSGGSTALGRVRLQIFDGAQKCGDFSVDNAETNFLWVTEFPLFTRADSEKDERAAGRWSSSHHPFTAPMLEDVHHMHAGNIEQVRGQHYDLVLNGVEIGGGSVRVHNADMQDFIFTQILQLNAQEKEPFNQLLHALRCGAPPHGGIALGFDRLMAILCNTQSIRDVIAFPKTGTGTDLLFRSPATVIEDVLQQYGLCSSDKSTSLPTSNATSAASGPDPLLSIPNS